VAGGEEGVGVMAKLAVISFRRHFFGGIFFGGIFSLPEDPMVPNLF